MEIVYSDHALKRMRQRGVTELDVEYALQFPSYIKKTFSERMEAVAIVRNRMIKIKFVEMESYIRIITVI